MVGGNHVLAQIFKDNHWDWREESRVCWAMGGKFIFSCIILCDVNASHSSNFFIRSHAGRFWINVKKLWKQNIRIKKEAALNFFFIIYKLRPLFSSLPSWPSDKRFLITSYFVRFSCMSWTGDGARWQLTSAT